MDKRYQLNEAQYSSDMAREIGQHHLVLMEIKQTFPSLVLLFVEFITR